MTVTLQSLGVAVMATLLFCTTAVAPQPAATTRPPDVLVVGGTPAGVAAAVAAARRGERVTLVARRAQLGGILTDAMMDQWDLNLARDGEPIQGGLFTEIYARLGDSFTPVLAAATFGDIVARESRITVVTSAVPLAVRTRDEAGVRFIADVRFRELRDQTQFTIAAPYVIDASDDGDVAALAGARYDLGRQDTGRDERMQPVTLMFSVTGIDWSRLASEYDPQRDGSGGATDRRAWGYAKLLRAYRPAMPDVVVSDLNLGREPGGAVTVNAVDVLGIDGRNDRDLARARARTEREAPRLIAWLRGRIPGFAGARIGRYADVVYVRETRHFAGVERLTADAVWDGTIPRDTIGLSSYPLDLHPITRDDKPAFAPIRHVYGVPFGSLVPAGFGNLVLASPAISASHLASGSARVIPTTIEEGEAAGAATALAAADRSDFSALARDREALDDLRQDLTRRGVILEPEATLAVSARPVRRRSVHVVSAAG